MSAIVKIFSDQLFQPLYQDATEKQMLKMQKHFAARCRSTDHRYLAISRSIFERCVQQVEDCNRELDTIAKALNDVASLTLLTQFRSEAGIANWEGFTENMNQTTTAQSRVVGARGE